MIEQMLQIGNTYVHYKTFGVPKSKEIIVILHGWGGSSESWKKVGTLLEEKGYFVVIPDLPGFGKTKIEKVYTLNDYAILIEQFVEKLDNTVKNKEKREIILWGHSNGGAIALTIAERKKLNIKTLILNNSAGIRNDTKRRRKRKIMNTLSHFIKKCCEKINIQTGNIWIQKGRKIFYKIIGGHDYLAAEGNPFLKETYLNMIQSDLRSIFPSISQNTLMIRGEKDTYTPPEDASIIKKGLPNAKLIILKNEKHGIHLHNPELLVDTFLKNISH